MNLHVNLSPARLLDTDRLRPLIAGSKRRVVIELTEYEAIGDYAELRAAIAALGENVGIGVDDAGSGYASLRHIQALRPDSVKLDLEWVHAIEGDPAIQALVTGLVRYMGPPRNGHTQRNNRPRVPLPLCRPFRRAVGRCVRAWSHLHARSPLQPGGWALPPARPLG